MGKSIRMSKPVYRIIGQWIGISLSATIAVMGTVVMRHMLETPQPLKSKLPGEALLYIWQKRSIFYKVSGAEDAPPLVLLHTPDIGASAYEMQALMEPLAQTYRVYAPDLPGFGLSDRPGVAYSAALYSEFCQAFVRDVVKKPATLLASGLSCNYAVSTAVNQPRRCDSLVLISPIALHGEQQRPALLKNFVEKPAIKALLYPLLSTRLGFALAHRRQQVSRTDFTQFYATTHQLGAEHAAMALLAGKLGEDSAQQFESLQQPVLMIWGTQALEDKRNIACLRDTTQRRQARQVELIQGAGLAVHQEQPASVINAIRRWQAETRLQLPTKAENHSQNNLAAFQAEVQAQAIHEMVSTPLPERSGALPLLNPTPALPITPIDQTNEVSFTQPASAEKKSELEQHIQNDISAPQTETPTIQAYCVKCKQKRMITNPVEFTTKNGRAAVRGTCPVCGSAITRMGGLT